MNFKELKVYCISLKRREDRRERISTRLNELGIEFEFFDGVDGRDVDVKTALPKGAIGCNLSHINLYQKLRNEEKPFLVIEDDVEFVDDLISQFNSINIPRDWALLYFGGNHNGEELDMVNERVHRLKKTFTTHCFAINPLHINLNSIIPEFANLYQELVIDEFLAYHVQTQYPCYGIHPHLAWQSNGFSDILNQEVKYEFLK